MLADPGKKFTPVGHHILRLALSDPAFAREQEAQGLLKRLRPAEALRPAAMELGGR